MCMDPIGYVSFSFEAGGVGSNVIRIMFLEDSKIFII